MLLGYMDISNGEGYIVNPARIFPKLQYCIAFVLGIDPAVDSNGKFHRSPFVSLLEGTPYGGVGGATSKLDVALVFEASVFVLTNDDVVEQFDTQQLTAFL